MYKSAIVNECNKVKCWCECMTDGISILFRRIDDRTNTR